MHYTRLLVVYCCITASAVFVAEANEVSTALLGEIASYPERSAPATVVSLNAAIISAEIPARIIQLPVRVGDIVEAGSTLAILDCTDYELAQRRTLANVDALAARLELARKRLQRTRTLRAQDTVAEEALDERASELAIIEAEFSAAQASTDVSANNISRCHIISPYSALVTERISAVGEFASAGTPLIGILDISDIEISAQVSVDDGSQIESAAEIFFTYSDRRYPVRLRTVLPAVNSDTRNQEVRLVFANDRAVTGAAGRLAWNDPRPHIPANLLVDRDGQLGVFIYTNGRVIFQPVEGAQSGRSSPVNLPEETYLVTEGQYSLQDNTQVQVVD